MSSRGAVYSPTAAGLATFFHKRSVEDSRIDWNRPAEEIERLVRAQSDPYPNAFTYHEGRRLRILAAPVSRGRYGGTFGRIFYREGDGVDPPKPGSSDPAAPGGARSGGPRTDSIRAEPAERGPSAGRVGARCRRTPPVVVVGLAIWCVSPLPAGSSGIARHRCRRTREPATG